VCTINSPSEAAARQLNSTESLILTAATESSSSSSSRGNITAAAATINLPCQQHGLKKFLGHTRGKCT